jgi:hypothetical protein
MGKNSDEWKETDHTQIDTGTSEINSSLEDSTHDRMLLHKAEPDELEQKALVTIPARLPRVVFLPPRKKRIVTTISDPFNYSRHRGSLFIILAAIVLFFVAISGSYVVLGTNIGGPVERSTNPQLSTSVVSAIVNIAPSHTVAKNTYTITLVTGQPDTAQKQVEGARIITSSQTQSLQVSATGKVAAPPINSTGTLLFSRIKSKKPVIIPAGAAFLDKKKVALVLNAPITLRAKSPLVSVSAHAIPAGLQGNVPALDINGTFCYPACTTGATFHLQNTAFSGGQVSQSYTFIQQSDINNAASQLENTLAGTTQTAIQSQIGTFEQQVGSVACGSSTPSTNQQAGAKVPDVTVFITERCRAEVYSVQAALNLATHLLNNDVTTLADPGYALVGSVTTQVLSLPELIDTHGTLLLRIMASGTAFYRVTSIQKHALAQLITGKSLAAAQTLLLNQRGIARVKITISDTSAGTLPDDASKISIVVVK